MVNDPLTCQLSGLNRPLKVHSRILHTDLWLIPADFASQSFDAPVYTVDECRVLSVLGLSPAELRAVHLTKSLFEGELSLFADQTGSHRQYERLMRRYQALVDRLDSQTRPRVESELLKVARQLSELLQQIEPPAENPAPGSEDTRPCRSDSRLPPGKNPG